MLILQVIKISHEIELGPSTYINLLTLIRKVMPNPVMITEKQFLISELLEMAKEKVFHFNDKLAAFINKTGN